MNIATLFSNNEKISIEAYLQKCGISNVDLFLHPNKSCIEPAENYQNIDKAYECLMEVINNENNN